MSYDPGDPIYDPRSEPPKTPQDLILDRIEEREAEAELAQAIEDMAAENEEHCEYCHHMIPSHPSWCPEAGDFTQINPVPADFGHPEWRD